LATDSSESDLNLIVTCSVKDTTANKMMHRIKSLKTKPLIVAGCLPKAEKSNVEKFSENASLLGPNSLGKTLDVINSTLLGRKQIALEDSDLSKVGLPKVRLNPTVGIVEIASGCMSECTFCQTKLSKGDLSSYRLGDIVRQVQTEIKEGCKEVWLTSTDNGCYGLDIGTDLPTLVNAVSEIQEDFMIRVGMMNPMYMPRIKQKLIESYDNDKVFKFLHLPVQSGSDKVLNDMKRGHTSETFREIVKRTKDRFDDFTISTDIIVGFPSETEEDFQKTLTLLDETKPDVVNLSKYSARPGTDAAELKQIDAAEIKRRSKIIFEQINKISLESNKKWIGWKGKVLFDENTEEGIKGRNYAYKPIAVQEKVSIGDSHVVEIIDATRKRLIGKIAS
jgi:MiaB-like tRNA modifying enzyme